MFLPVPLAHALWSPTTMASSLRVETVTTDIKTFAKRCGRFTYRQYVSVTQAEKSKLDRLGGMFVAMDDWGAP
jgi:hypothetical protein